VTTTLTRRYRFSASHRLHIAELSEEENTSLYGKCNNPFGHGHDYVLDVTVAGRVDETTGLMLAVDQLDRLVIDKVLARFHHRNINLDVPQFANLVPTTENIVLIVTDLIRQNWAEHVGNSACLWKVHVQETDRSGFEVLVPSELKRKSKNQFLAVEVNG
jgi:6-pyruvoyltetrahydropterin/6-carboxytetrahydropterin synthase